jgi:hypothetical protein
MTPDRPDPAAATDFLPADRDRAMHVLELLTATIAVLAAILLGLGR